ncbi:MAG TPA: hypothetical protein VF329_01205 [Gammaproteobacteria bacterium]
MAPRALGISLHTGWGACVVAGGSPAAPEIVANEIIEILGDSERFCFHIAAEMKAAEAERWIARARDKAVANAARALAPLVARASICALVAKGGSAGTLEAILASHPRIHTAEGCFYRDAVREACTIPVRLVPPRALDPSKVGKLAPPPWGKDQKLAVLAAWSVLAEARSAG